MLKLYVDEAIGRTPAVVGRHRRFDDLGQMGLSVIDERALDANEELGCQGLVAAEEADEHAPGWLGLLSG
jgi:hypothetical protein